MKKSSLKNTFVSTTFIILLSSLVLTSCKKDNMETLQEPETEFSIPEYHPIITEGCDPLNHVIDTMDFPYIDINQLIGGGTSAGEREKSIWAGLGTFFLQQGGSTLLSVFTKPLINMLSTAIFGGDDVSEKLDMVLDKLDVIEQDMNTLMSMTQQALSDLGDLQFNDLHNHYSGFQGILTGLRGANDLCMNRLKVIESNSQNLDSDALDQQIWDVMDEWGTTILSCGSAFLALDQICNVYLFASGPEYHNQHRNMFAIYDVIVFHNTPWEKTGYDIRDMFRAAVAAETLRTAWLTALYYRSRFNYKGDITQDFLDGKLNGIKTTINGLNTLFSNNTVERHPNVVKCQLHDALFTLQPDALEEHKSWTHTKSNGLCVWLESKEHVFSSGTFGSTTPNVDDAYNSQLSDVEINRITTYYRSGGHGKNYTILNCLEDGGLILPSYYNTIFTFQPGSSNAIAYSEPVYFLSQGTSANVYINNAQNEGGIVSLMRYCIRLSGFYNVGIPLDGYISAGGTQCHGYEPAFYNDYIHTTYERMVTINDYLHALPNPIRIENVEYYLQCSKWGFMNNFTHTFTFPGRYFLWFKKGSLNRYDIHTI